MRGTIGIEITKHPRVGFRCYFNDIRDISLYFYVFWHIVDMFLYMCLDFLNMNLIG